MEMKSANNNANGLGNGRKQIKRLVDGCCERVLQLCRVWNSID